MAMFLRPETCEDRLDLAPTRSFIQLDERIRGPYVAVVLRDLVFKNQMATKGVPCQFTNQPVILVQVVAVVSEDKIWR